jgi:hypothetical protein
MDDREIALKLLGPWTLEGAIKERVEREATAEWALRQAPPFQAIPPMPVVRWQPAPLHALLSKILP